MPQLLAPTPAPATIAQRPPFQLADMYRLRLVDEIAVSPDGQRVAYTVYGYREAENDSYWQLWLAAADGSTEPRPLTRGEGNPTALAWSPDGGALAVLMSRPAEPELAAAAKDTPERPQVWSFDLTSGGEPRQLTNRPEGVAAFDWAPDGTQLVIAARDPSPDQAAYLTSIRGKLDEAGGEAGPYVITRTQHKWCGVGYLDNVRTHLFVVDVASRAERQLTAGPCDETEPQWSPDGAWIAFVSNRTGDPDNNHRHDLWLVRPAGGGTMRLTTGDLHAWQPRWSPDSAALAFLAAEAPDAWAWTQTKVYLVALTAATPVADLAACVGEGWSTIGGVVAAEVVGDPVAHARVPPRPLVASPVTVLTAALDRDVEAAPVWLDPGTLLTLIADRGQTRLAQVSTAGVTTLGYPHAFDQGDLHALDAAGGTVALISNRANAGADLFTLPMAAAPAAGDALRQVTRLNDAIFGERANVTYAEVSYQNSDGDTITALVIQPPGFDPAQGPYPLILYPHGGPMGYDRPALHFYPNWFNGDAYMAGQGYLVLQPNYRGSTSFGRDFCWEIRGDLGRREYDDIITGVDHLIAQGWADPSRLFVTGVSYGGKLTAWCTGSSDRFQAAVADLPAWDNALSIGAGDLHSFFQLDFGLLWQNPAAYQRSAASSLILSTHTPTLIMTADQDWRCPPSMSEAYYVALKKLGVPTELVVYQNDHHAYTRPRRAADRIIRVLSWFAAHGGIPFTDDSAAGYPSQD